MTGLSGRTSLVRAFVFLLVTAFSGLARSASAQIQITLPTTRAVFQRDNNNCTSLTIAGNYTRLVDRVEARLVARQGGSTTGWTTIQVIPRGACSGVRCP